MSKLQAVTPGFDSLRVLPSKRWLLGLFCVLTISAGAIDGPLSPEQSLQYLKTEPGLKVELVAAEPMVISPVATAWDEQGRMFVVEDRGYPVGPGKGKPPEGQVVLLVDTDGDGNYDRRTVFADGLTFPNGVLPWAGGIYVTCAPYLYYFKDTDGDGKADLKQIVFKGFQDLSTTQLRVSHPLLNLDNWIYLTSGLTAAKVTSPAHSNRPPVLLNRVDGRFRPGTDEIEECAGTAQFGQSFDAFGRKFVCSNRNHIQQVMLQTRYQKRNPHFSFPEVVEDIPEHGAACRVYPLSANITTAASHTGYFTSACGLLVYLGTALPESYRGNSFTCEPAGNLVHHDVLSANGVAFLAKRAYPTNEFLASPDNWFRPVNLALGPDGALYVCDMYRKTIEHPDYLPEHTRKITDFESGKDRGRIYKITAAQPAPKSKNKPSDLRKLSPRQLVGLLEHANGWQRWTAHRLILELQDKKSIPPLSALVRKGKTPEARVHALRLLQGLGSLNPTDLEQALVDQHPAVREHALELSEPHLAASPRLVSQICRLADDPDARVRFQCALSLGALDSDEILSPLLKIAGRDAADRWSRAGVLTALDNREQLFFHHLVRVASGRSSSRLTQLMGELTRGLGAGGLPDELVAALREILEPVPGVNLSWQLTALGGLGEGLRTRSAADDVGTLSDWAVKTGMPERLEALFKQAESLARDPKAELQARLGAVSLLGQANESQAVASLEPLLDPQQPAEIQTAAIRALSRGRQSGIGPKLVKRERWSGYTPAVRDVALSALMSQTNFVHALFDAIDAGDVAAWTVNADRRTALMKNKDESIRQRATALFKDLTPGDRMKVYEDYKSVLSLKPVSPNGHSVFQKSCVTCHVVSGEGKLVGPDLTGIRNQPADVLLLHIIVPEYEIMPVYTAYNVETREGEAFTGLLAAETADHITLRMAQGLEQQVARSDIVSMTTSRLSLMPQELEKTMSRQDLADLIGFLKGE